jgi:hypothetical protein
MQFWWENLREENHLTDPGVRWVDNIKMDGMRNNDLVQDRDR